MNRNYSRIASALTLLTAFISLEFSAFAPAYGESMAGSMAGSQASLEAGTPGHGRRRGGRRAYWRRQRAEASRANRKQIQSERSRLWTGDHR